MNIGNRKTSQKDPVSVPSVVAEVDVNGRRVLRPVKLLATKATVQGNVFVSPSPIGKGLVASVLDPEVTATKVATVATTPDLMARLVEVGVPGVVAKTAWSGVQISNTMTESQIVQALIENNVTETFAGEIASDVLKIFKSTPFKALLIAVSAGGAAWSIAKFFRLSPRNTLLAVVAAALVAVIGFLMLCWAGVMAC